MKESVPIFGAGALSLGFLGPMLAAEYEPVFCDLDARKDVIVALRRDHRYLVNICSREISPVCVSGVSGLNVSDDGDRRQAKDLVKKAGIAFTSVGSRGIDDALRFIKESRGDDRTALLHVFSCENDARMLERWSGALGDGIALHKTVMGRMCRLDRPGEDYRALAPEVREAVVAEDFSGLPISAEIHRQAGLRGGAWQVMSEREFDARARLKLYGHNGAHAYVAYLGALRGLTYFHQAGRDILSGAERLLLGEVAPAMLNAYGDVLSRRDVEEYCGRLVGRITGRAFGDTVERGVRGSMDKIAAGERLVEGARFILGNGCTPEHYCRIIAAGILLNMKSGVPAGSHADVIAGHCRIREKELVALVAKGLEELS